MLPLDQEAPPAVHRFVSLALAALVLALVLPARGTAASQEEGERRAVPQHAAEALQNSVVLAYIRERGSRSEDGGIVTCGTGFVLRSGGLYLLTNTHVGGTGRVRSIAQRDLGRYELVFEAPGGQIGTRRMQRESRQQDLTWFRLSGSPLGGIDRVRRFEDLEEGELVYALGNRFCEGWLYSAGRVTQKLDRSTFGSNDAAEIDALLSALAASGTTIQRERYNRVIVAERTLAAPGNSGGPVVDEHGRLVGVIWAGGPGGSYVMPVEYVYRNIGARAPRTSPRRGTQPAATADDWDAEEASEEEDEIVALPSPAAVVDPFARRTTVDWIVDEATGTLRAVEQEDTPPQAAAPAALILLRYERDESPDENFSAFTIADPRGQLGGAQELRWRENRESRRLPINDLAPADRQATLRRFDDGTARLRVPGDVPAGTEFEIRSGDGRAIQLWPQPGARDR